MTFLIILILVTIILIAGTLIGIACQNESMWGSFATLLGIIILTGWFLIGCLCPLSATYVDINPKVYKTETAVIIETKNLRTIMEDAKSYNLINDSTKFQLKSEYNMYGFNLENIIVIKESKEIESINPTK